VLRYVLKLSSMLSSVVGLKQFAQVFRGAEAVYTGMKWRQCCILINKRTHALESYVAYSVLSNKSNRTGESTIQIITGLKVGF
jgi:hypothetical protein